MSHTQRGIKHAFVLAILFSDYFVKLVRRTNLCDLFSSGGFCQRMRERNRCVCVHVPMIQVSSHSPHTKLNINTNSKSTMLCNATQGNGMLKLIAHYFEIEAAFVLLIKTISNSFSLIMVILASFCTFRFVFIVPFASLSHIIKVKIHCIWTSAENHSKFYLCAMLLNIFKAIFEFVRSQITQMKAKTARSVSTM